MISASRSVLESISRATEVERTRKGFTLLEALIAAGIAVLIAGSAILVLRTSFRLFSRIGANEKTGYLVEKTDVMECIRGDVQGLLGARKEGFFQGTEDSFSGERLLFIVSANRWEPVAVSWRRHEEGGMERIVKRLAEPEHAILEKRAFSWPVSFEYGSRASDSSVKDLIWTDSWVETNTLPDVIRYSFDGTKTLVFIPLAGSLDEF